MNLNFLKTFICVVDEGNYSRAANRLHLSQPAVSMQMQTLTQELGVDLFRRSGHRVETTEAGAMLYEQASLMLRSWHTILRQMEGLRQRLKGRLELGASTAPGDFLLPSRLCDFYKLHPDVEVRMTVAPSQEIINSLVSGRLDMAVVGFKPQNDGLDSEVLFTDDLVAVFSGDNCLCKRNVITAEDIVSQPMLMRTQGSATRQVLETALAAAGGNPGKIQAVMELGSSRALLEAAARGLGMAVVSRLTAADYVEQGRLVWRSISGLEVRRSFWLVLTSRSYSPAAQAFAEYLRRGDKIG